MRKLLAVIFIVLNMGYLLAFEGNIHLTRQSRYDTTYLIFYIKASRVRVDEFSSSGKLTKTLLVNLDTNNILALSPELKMYADITNKEAVDNPKVEINKTENFKMIEGKKCYQWRVRSRSTDCEVTYWVTELQLPEIKYLFHVLEATESYSSIPSYYLQIPASNGFVPMVAIERNLVREQKQLIKITSINPQKVSSGLFNVPADYRSLCLSK